MNSKRNIYLKMKPLEEAREIILQRFPFHRTRSKETISAPDAVGRVLAEPVAARISSPNFHLSAMDGIAVKAENTFGAAETSPKELRVGVDAFYVNTGHVMPRNTDAVIMIEHVHVLDPNRLEIEAPAFPWQNVRKIGEEIVATELLFPRHHVVTPYCVGALLAGGIFTVPVRPRPRILIIPTGTELVDWRTADGLPAFAGAPRHLVGRDKGQLVPELIGCNVVGVAEALALERGSDTRSGGENEARRGDERDS